MNARWPLVVIFVTAIVPIARSQPPQQGQFGTTPWQFQWKKDAILTYHVQHDTAVTDVTAGGKQQYGSRLTLTKRYRVMDVDNRGTATLEYSVTAMRNEQTRPDGDVLLFDSTDLNKSTPAIRDQLAKYVGVTLAVLRVDANGNVVAVKQGDPDRYGAEPPFTLTIPDKVPSILPGVSWSRKFDVTLNPPLGTGEKYAAEQEYNCKSDDRKYTIAVKTTFKNMPAAVQEQIPLVPKELHGEIIFDAGRVTAVRLSVDRTLENHQGPGSSYRFQSTYAEELVAK
jgi:hypothetical protein